MLGTPFFSLKFKRTALVIFLIGIFLSLALNVILLRHNIRKNYTLLAVTQNKIFSQENKKHLYLAKYRKLTNPNLVEKVAKNKLNMRKPNKVEYVIND